MPIKGKKKPANRGSRSRRAPSSAPHVVSAGRRRTPWHKTLAGRAVAGITVLALLSLVIGLVVNARSNGNAAGERREALERYAGEIRALLQRVSPPAGEVAALATVPASQIVNSAEDDAQAWTKTFQESATEAGAITPPVEVAPAHGLFVDSILLYGSSARTYGLAAGLEAGVQNDVLIQASEQRARAESVWANAAAVVDRSLAGAGGEPSGLTAPSAGGPAQIPPP
ncbi:MAG: hypothetical protein M3333_04915, partial [Actinomycetota bacterium]|nr:hypothetical protein [Actinomycetota bacterium]